MIRVRLFVVAAYGSACNFGIQVCGDVYTSLLYAITVFLFPYFWWDGF